MCCEGLLPQSQTFVAEAKGGRAVREAPIDDDHPAGEPLADSDLSFTKTGSVQFELRRSCPDVVILRKACRARPIESVRESAAGSHAHGA